MAKRKEAIKSGPVHWSAFGEKIWGRSQLEALLDEFKKDVETGVVLSIEHFRGKKEIPWTTWRRLRDKNPFFDEGIKVIKDKIYGKREQLVYDENKNPIMLKDLTRYSEDHYQDLRRPVRDDHELRKELEEIKINLQTGDPDKKFEVNLFLDGKRINEPPKEGSSNE